MVRQKGMGTDLDLWTAQRLALWWASRTERGISRFFV